MARIRQEDIEAVRERTDILKLIGGYLALRRAGADSHVGICPFHQEKSPSLSVSPAKGVYYCFGCGAKGDAINFLREVESLEFAEAVERLAKDAGVTLRYEEQSPADRRAASRRQALSEANARAGELYHSMLLEGREGEDARSYLAARGIDRPAIERFGLGYAPAHADFLLRRLSQRFSPELLVEAGLAVRDTAGAGIRDRFRGRVMFPVHDLAGRAVGFGARVLPRRAGQPAVGDGPEGPKYLNSPETPIYRKGEMLYNLNRAKPSVARGGEAVLVEGYTDVIALAQAGVDTALATCGTALSEGHFRLLARFARRAVLAFDSDEAGARAAERAHAFHERFDLDAVVLVLPEGLDPADFVRANGGDAFRTAAAGAVPLVEYMIRRSLAGGDLSTIEGRERAVRAAAPIVAGLREGVRREEYAHLLADAAGVSDLAVQRELERVDVAGTGPPAAGAMAPAGAARRANGAGEAGDPVGVSRLPKQHRVEREMLKLLVQDADIYRGFVEKLREDHFDRAQHRRLFMLVRQDGAEVRSLVAGVEDERLADLLAQVAVEVPEGDRSLAYAEGIFDRLQEFLLDRRIDALKRRLEPLNPITHPEYDEMFEELIDLEGERRRLRAVNRSV